MHCCRLLEIFNNPNSELELCKFWPLGPWSLCMCKGDTVLWQPANTCADSGSVTAEGGNIQPGQSLLRLGPTLTLTVETTVGAAALEDGRASYGGWTLGGKAASLPVPGQLLTLASGGDRHFQYSSYKLVLSVLLQSKSGHVDTARRQVRELLLESVRV